MKKILICLMVLLTSSVILADTFRTIRTNGKLEASKNPAQEVQTVSANTVTPNLSNGLVVITGLNTTANAITGFSNAIAGNIVYIVGNASTTSNPTTIADSGAFKLSASFTASANNTLTLFVRASGDYVELGRSAN